MEGELVAWINSKLGLHLSRIDEDDEFGTPRSDNEDKIRVEGTRFSMILNYRLLLSSFADHTICAVNFSIAKLIKGDVQENLKLLQLLRAECQLPDPNLITPKKQVVSSYGTYVNWHVVCCVGDAEYLYQLSVEEDMKLRLLEGDLVLFDELVHIAGAQRLRDVPRMHELVRQIARATRWLCPHLERIRALAGIVIDLTEYENKLANLQLNKVPVTMLLLGHTAVRIKRRLIQCALSQEEQGALGDLVSDMLDTCKASRQVGNTNLPELLDNLVFAIVIF